MDIIFMIAAVLVCIWVLKGKGEAVILPSFMIIGVIAISNFYNMKLGTALIVFPIETIVVMFLILFMLEALKDSKR